MNVQAELIERMEQRLLENKSGVKTYKTYEKAAAKAAELAKSAGEYFRCGDLRYMVVQLSNGRFAFGHDLTEASRRPTFAGGYLLITGGYTY